MKRITRQARDQQRNVQNGMCRYHVSRPVGTTWDLCEECAVKYGRKWMPHALRREMKSKVDWTQPIEDIAKALNITVGTAYVYRQSKTRGTEHSLHSQRDKKWRAVDWTQNDEVIASALDVTVPAVRYQRKKRNK
jgi:hypothetical protein